MSEEKRDARPDEEIVDEMPDTGGAPCGDVFEADAIYVTDAAAAIVGDDQDG